jgi:hypothetical protein
MQRGFHFYNAPLLILGIGPSMALRKVHTLNKRPGTVWENPQNLSSFSRMHTVDHLYLIALANQCLHSEFLIKLVGMASLHDFRRKRNNSHKAPFSQLSSHRPKYSSTPRLTFGID